MEMHLTHKKRRITLVPNRMPRISRPVINRNLAYLADVVGIVNPFSETAARKAEANAASALASDHQRINDIDEILKDHDLLAQKIESSS
jgi:hypothetical protein